MGSIPEENSANRSLDIGIPADFRGQQSDAILNSWKEIAQYLGRGVRTVQRWERDFRLPIHRPKGQNRSATLALSSELDEWLREAPVRSRPDGHTGNGSGQSSQEDKCADLSVVRAGRSLAKIEHRRRHLILSVDDEGSLLFTREKILESQGYEVFSAAEGERALEIFGKHAIDLVILDYKMPGMDGGTVAKEMKTRNPLVPIVMVSGNRVPGEALATVDCFIPKGDGPELLLAAIHQFLGNTTDGANQ
jgi:CheY-like chemotaxis protein